MDPGGSTRQTAGWDSQEGVVIGFGDRIDAARPVPASRHPTIHDQVVAAR